MIPLAGIAEPFSSLSHLGGGVLFSIIALVVLLPRVRGNRHRMLAFAAYGVGVGGMFFASGTYHLFDAQHSLHDPLRTLDHAMIWLAIVGTMSMVVLLECHRWQRQLQIVGWAIALTGLLGEGLFLRAMPSWVSAVLYIAMGWIGVFPVAQIARRRRWKVVVPLVAGGVFSTAGGLADALDWPSFYPRVFEAHETLHVLIFVGMMAFQWTIYQSLRSEEREPAAEQPAARAPV